PARSSSLRRPGSLAARAEPQLNAASEIGKRLVAAVEDDLRVPTRVGEDGLHLELDDLVPARDERGREELGPVLRALCHPLEDAPRLVVEVDEGGDVAERDRRTGLVPEAVIVAHDRAELRRVDDGGKDDL